MSCKLIIEGIPFTTNEHQKLEFARDFRTLATNHRCEYEVTDNSMDYTGVISIAFLAVMGSFILWKLNVFGKRE